MRSASVGGAMHHVNSARRRKIKVATEESAPINVEGEDKIDSKEQSSPNENDQGILNTATNQSYY